MTQPEALRLAAALIERHGVESFQGDAAAELRRLSIENDALGLHLSERMKDLAAVEAQRDAFLAALQLIASDACADMPTMMQNIARAAVEHRRSKE